MSSFRESSSSKKQEIRPLDGTLPILAGSADLADCLNGWILEDGKNRGGCKLSIFAESGNLKVCIRDEWARRQAFAILDPMKNLSDALRELVEDGGLEWRDMPRNK